MTRDNKYFINMKLKHIIATSVLAFSLGLGVMTGMSENKDVVETKAESTITTLYINQFDGGGTWADFSYYLFNSTNNNVKNAEFPGVKFTDSMKTSTPNEYDQYQYVLEIDTSTYDTLILAGKPSGWSGSAQTEDLKIANMTGNGLYCGNQIPNSAKFYTGYYTYSTKTVYMLDLKGSVYNSNHYVHTFATNKSGTTWPGVKMTKVSGTNNLYSAEINSALNNVIFNNYDGSKTNNQTATITEVADGNAYIVYPNNGYNTTTLDTATFVDSYMKFETVWLDEEGTGLCKSNNWYSDAKTAFTSKTDDQKTSILAHEPTAARLEAWASANGNTFNSKTGVFSATRTLISFSSSSSFYITLVATIILALIVLVGTLSYFYIHKRKEY